jgi:hypothetical protein
VGGSSCSRDLGPGRRSTEMISDRCLDANREVLVKRVGEHPLPTTQAWGLWRPGPPVAAPRARDSHIDPFGHLSPGQALITELQDLIRGGGMRWRTTTTHGAPGAPQLIADRGLREAQLGSDLAQGLALGVEVGCTLNVHRDTVTSRSAASRFVRVCGAVPVMPAMRSPADGR